MDLKFAASCMIAACWTIAISSLLEFELFNWAVFQASLPIAWVVVAATTIGGAAYVYFHR